ncbi:MAG: ATP-binding protein [Acidaminococcaceae bacterium]
MMRKRLMLAVQGVFLVAFLLIGAWILSLFQNYSTNAFRENCVWQTRYAQSRLLAQRTPMQTLAQTRELTQELAAELGLDLMVVSGPDTAAAEEVRLARQQQLGTAIRGGSTAQDKTLYVAVPLTEDLVLRSATALTPVTAAYGQVRLAVIGGFLLLLLLAAFLASRIARRILLPLEELATVATKLSQGDLTVRLQRTASGEFALLGQTLNLLADNLTTQMAKVTGEQRKLALVLKNMDNGVLIVGVDGQILVASAQFKSYFPGQQVLGRQEFDLLQSVAVAQLVDKCLAQNQAQQLNISLILEGRKRSFQVFGAPLMAAYQSVPTEVLLVFHDITALAAVYEKQAEFVSNASHELATPLTTIKGFAETLLDGAGTTDEATQHKFLGIIYQESQRMQALIQDLLQLARLDLAEYRQSITREAFVPTQLLETLCEELQPQAEQRNLHLVYAYDQPPSLLLSNRDWLKQVLVNLAENALKYTPPGGTITLSYSQDEAFARFTVHNTGEGISEQDAQRIFDRFYRVDKARTRQVGGTGLGLSIVKFVVELFGGTIRVVSGKGQGTGFVFTVPRQLNK